MATPTKDSGGRRFHVGLRCDERARGGERDHNLRVTGWPVEVEERSHIARPNPCRSIRPGCSLQRSADPAHRQAICRVLWNGHPSNVVGGDDTLVATAIPAEL